MKGLLFSLIATLLTLTLLSLIFVHSSLISYNYRRIAIRSRVEALINFYDALLKDAEKALRVVSRRAISAAVSYVITNGEGLEDASESIEELILKGSINGTPQPLMEDATILTWKQTIESLALLKGFNVSSSIQNVDVKAYDSFNLLVSFDFYLNVSDIKGTAKISRLQKVKTLVSIEGFEDPLYPLNTLGRVTNVIIKSKHWGNYSSTDLSNLKEDLYNSWYHPSLYGASFLDRLEGKYFVEPDRPRVFDIIGLESFVDKEELQTYGIDVYVERSNIDYLYFSGGTYPVYRIDGMPETFRLDNETTINNLTHLQVYNVTDRVL